MKNEDFIKYVPGMKIIREQTAGHDIWYTNLYGRVKNASLIDKNTICLDIQVTKKDDSLVEEDLKIYLSDFKEEDRSDDMYIRKIKRFIPYSEHGKSWIKCKVETECGRKYSFGV